MGKVLSVAGGLIAIILGVWGLIAWWMPFLEVLKGTIPCFLILGGLITTAAGISEIKSSLAEKKTEEKK